MSHQSNLRSIAIACAIAGMTLVGCSNESSPSSHGKKEASATTVASEATRKATPGILQVDQTYNFADGTQVTVSTPKITESKVNTKNPKRATFRVGLVNGSKDAVDTTKMTFSLTKPNSKSSLGQRVDGGAMLKPNVDPGKAGAFSVIFDIPDVTAADIHVTVPGQKNTVTFHVAKM